MASVRVSIAANFVGKVWAALISIAVVPLYVHFVGVEAYGLIGIFYSLLAMTSLFDLGLSAVLMRELAKLREPREGSFQPKDILRTVEVPYWCVGIVLCCCVIAAAPVLADYWLKPKALSTGEVEGAIVLMGIALCFQWPFALYSGGLIGIERQVLLNALTAGFATFKAIGALVFLWALSADVRVFFAWQVVASLAQTVAVALALWKSLPQSQSRGVFRREILVQTWGFAAGMSGTALISVLLTQADKVVLSKILSLEAFGYYSFATSAANALFFLISPVTTAVFPRMTRLAEEGNPDELKRLFHQSVQLASVLIVPFVLTFAGFTEDILLLWTRNERLVEQTATISTLLMIAMGCNGIMNLVYALQTAFGETRLIVWQHAIAAILVVPLIVWAGARYGSTGAAWVWLSLYAATLIIVPPIVYAKFLPGEYRKWLWWDIVKPTLLSGIIIGFGVLCIPETDILLGKAVWIGLIYVVATLLHTIMSDELTRYVYNNLRTFRRVYA